MRAAKSHFNVFNDQTRYDKYEQNYNPQVSQHTSHCTNSFHEDLKARWI